jgi:hypothetical protein
MTKNRRTKTIKGQTYLVLHLWALGHCFVIQSEAKNLLNRFLLRRNDKKSENKPSGEQTYLVLGLWAFVIQSEAKNLLNRFPLPRNDKKSENKPSGEQTYLVLGLWAFVIQSEAKNLLNRFPLPRNDKKSENKTIRRKNLSCIRFVGFRAFCHSERSEESA